jgi:hypothetical protein
MDEIRINPEEMESGGAREGGRQGLDDATFDPNASIEQSGDFRQAESTQHLMADLTKDSVPEERKIPIPMSPGKNSGHGPGAGSESKINFSGDEPDFISYGSGMRGKTNRGTVEARSPETIPGREDTEHAKEASHPGHKPGYGPGYGGGHKPGKLDAALPRKTDAREVFLNTYKGAVKKANEPSLGKPPEESGDRDGPPDGSESEDTTEHQDEWQGQA